MINSLNVAQTGLKAARVSVENVMNNIANANTEGYKKRVVETSELAHSDDRIYGRGISIDDTVRISSQYLYDNIIKENSKEMNYTELSSILENVESIFKETEGSGLSADLDRYYQTVENLRSNPNSEIYKSELKQNAQLLVDDIKRLYENIEAEESLTKSSLEQNVKEINTILDDIALINKQMKERGQESNDLLDKRDLLEKELSNYVDIKVNRDIEGLYELKIGGEIAVINTNALTLSVSEEYTPQKDRYVLFDENTKTNSSSILEGETFDEEDIIVFELNNTSSVSVQYGETMTFDLDGDGTVETINVDETNYIRALSYKINTSTELASSVRAFNGDYSINESGSKTTDDTSDSFLLIESKTDGVSGRFDSRISFIQQEYSSIESNLSFSPVLSDNQLSINSSISEDGLSLSHVIELATASASTETFDIVLDNNGSATGSSISIVPSSVIYDSSAKTLTIPAGVTSFTMSMDTDSTVDLNTEADYSITLGTGGSQASLMTSTLTANNTGTEILQSYKISVSEDGGSPFTVIDSINSTATSDGTSITHNVNLSSATSSSQVFDVNFSDDTGDYFTLNPVFIPSTVSYDVETNQITVPAGISSFSITTATNELASAGTDQNYSFSITDNDGGATGTTPITITSSIKINDTEAKIGKSIFKTEDQSNDANNGINLQVFDENISVGNGKLKAILDNLNTDSGNNKYEEFKKSLDDFTKTFVDITSSYIKNSDGSYISGEIATDADPKIADDIALFSGSNVKTLTFNKLAVGSLEQKDYDYLATIQWKEDISFAGYGQGDSTVASDTEVRSFSEFYQDLRLNISRSKENTDFYVESQKVINESLNSSYDQMTKVDNDEEMINLIKFQAAYSANAKMITVVDEMLSTLLGIKS